MSKKIWVLNTFCLLILSCFLLTFLFTLQANSKIFFLEADYYQDKKQERKITLGKGEIISSDKEVSRVVVSDPSIADLQMLNQKQIFVRAKKLGICTFLVWEKSAIAPTRFDISIWPDIDYLTQQLHELDENISVDYIPPNTSSISEGSGQGAATPPDTGAATAGGAAPAQTSVGAALGTATTTQGSSSSSTTGRIILKGEVKNAEIIARALQIAGAYVGDQGIRIISQPGGQVVDGLAGEYDLSSNSDAQDSSSSQSSATAFGARTSLAFTSNRRANLSRGVIATTQNGSVISFLRVKDPPQISVAIRFYEIQRSTARNLGFNTLLGGHTLQGSTSIGGDGISQITGNSSVVGNLLGFMAQQDSPEFTFGPRGVIADGSFLVHTLGMGITGTIFSPDLGFGAAIQALQERGEVKTLAEPNLVIANGEPASFLAGGEVPIIRSVFTAGGTSQDVTYEPFGIKFNILPTVVNNDRIYLQLVPEIRDIDAEVSSFVVPPGSTAVRPPAFKTRRTQTQVELESGQALAISGLLREDNTRNLRKVPGVGDIPILGTLFRSKAFRNGQSELLIVVTPQIIRPTTPDKITKQLSIPEIPYHDFDQLAPRHPYHKPDDEKGPDLRKPLDAGKYYTPIEDEIIMASNDFVKPNVEELLKETKAISKKLEMPKQVKVTKKLEKKMHARKKEQEKLTKKLEAKRQEELKNQRTQEELAKHQEDNKYKWKKESEQYAQAKEAMRLARQNKF